jgi:hypothetical protein
MRRPWLTAELASGYGPDRPYTARWLGAPPSRRPALARFTPEERRLALGLGTPRLVQRWLNELPYNHDHGGGATLRAFRGVVRAGTAHCLEAVLAAATILEQHGHPPLALSFDSADNLDHVIYVYRQAGRWGSVARSRDPGLHGRKPVFATPRALALSYVDPYVDLTGRIVGYAVVNLDVLGGTDWRLAEGNVWRVERLLVEWPHRPLRTSLRRHLAQKRRYRAFIEENPGQKPVFYSGRDRWTELPRTFSLG